MTPSRVALAALALALAADAEAAVSADLAAQLSVPNAAWQGACIGVKLSNPWFDTLRGRAGATFGDALLYGTVSLAYGALRGENTFLGTSQTSTEFGWVAGAGIDMTLTRNWSSKIEYLHVDLEERPYWTTGTTSGSRRISLFFV